MNLRPAPPRPETRRARAFTLVEVLVSMCVVGVLFVSLYAGITAGFGVMSQTREQMRATQVMIDKMETLRLYSWTQISTFGTSTSYIPSTFYEAFYPTTTNYSGSTTSTNAAGLGLGFVYHGTVAITNAGFTENYSNSMKLVTITLRWTNGTARSQTMSTYVSQYGIQNYIY
jgi:prepilin-type N-terminal cleavage/methylation domain-containing protein